MSALDHWPISTAHILHWWKHCHHFWPWKCDTAMIPNGEEHAEKHGVMKTFWASLQSSTDVYGCTQCEHAAKGRFLSSKMKLWFTQCNFLCFMCCPSVCLMTPFWRRPTFHSRSPGFLPEADTLVKAVWLIVFCEKLSSSSPVKCSSKHLQFYNYHLEAQKHKLMQCSDSTCFLTGLWMKELFHITWCIEMQGLSSLWWSLNLKS